MVNCSCDQILPKKHLPKYKPQELITQYAWNRPQLRPASLPVNRLKAAKKVCSVKVYIEHSMHCIKYVKREQEKPLLLKLTLRSRLTLSRAHSLLSRAISCVWLFNI